jgi:hypothetical protein
MITAEFDREGQKEVPKVPTSEKRDGKARKWKNGILEQWEN